MSNDKLIWLLRRAISLCDQSRGPEAGHEANEQWDKELLEIKKELDKCQPKQ